MDIASLIGTLMGLAMVLFGIIQSAGVSTSHPLLLRLEDLLLVFWHVTVWQISLMALSQREMLLSYIRMTRVRLLEISLIFQILPEKRGFLHWKKQRMILMMTF